MFFNKLSLVLVAILVFATPSFAQTVDSVGKTWVKTVSINPQFPNPDKVRPGDVIWVEIAGQRKSFVANPDSINSQWAATVAALKKTSPAPNAPIFLSIVPNKGLFEPNVFWPLMILALAMLTLIYFTVRTLAKRNKLQEEERNHEVPELEDITSEETPVVEEEQSPPILEEVPNFESATPEELHQSAELAVANTYRGRNFEIIGDVEKGMIDGRMVIFFKDADDRVEEFHNEPGYRTTVRFLDTNEVKSVVWRAACFNPLWSASDANFFGTFTPEVEGAIPQPIPSISGPESEELKNLITSDAEPVLPKKQEPAAVSDPVVLPPPVVEKEICLNELTLVNGKTIIKGEIPLSGKNNELLIQLINGISGREVKK
jgi:hypothetical protein